jgi:hypothetical protein
MIEITGFDNAESVQQILSRPDRRIDGGDRDYWR